MMKREKSLRFSPTFGQMAGQAIIIRIRGAIAADMGNNLQDSGGERRQPLELKIGASVIV
jgi:hypothetical protein